MATYTQILYHLVFSTKYRRPVLILEKRDELFKYIWGILQNKQCFLYRINGVEDHLHIATHIHPTIALSSLIKEIKVSSSIWIKENKVFPDFTSWQVGYGGFTCSHRGMHRLIKYIKNQEIHHRKENSMAEIKRLLKEHGVKYDKKYLL